MSAEPDVAARTTTRRDQSPSPRPTIDHLSDEKVGQITGGLEAALRDLPVPRQPGHAQRQAIDKLFRAAP
jgi:hypothetical protein